MKTFSDRLRFAMEGLEISQSELARHLGIGQATVSGWLNESIPQRRMIKLLAEALCVREEWLLTGSGRKFDPQSVKKRVHLTLARPPANYKLAFEALVGGMSDATLQNEIKRMLAANQLEAAEVLLQELKSRKP